MTFADSLVYVIDDDMSMLKAVGRTVRIRGLLCRDVYWGAGVFLLGRPIQAPHASFSI